MNDKNRAALGMVYPLADTLRMTLILNIKKWTDGDELSLHGDQKLKLQVSPGVEFNAVAEIKASNVTPETSWVLMKVSGFLWTMLAFNRKDNELYLWLIDAAKIKESERPKTGGMYQGGKSVQYLLDRLLPGVVRIYKRKRDDAEWKLIDQGEAAAAHVAEKNNYAIGISGPLSPGEARDTPFKKKGECSTCLGIGWVETGKHSWKQCVRCDGSGKSPEEMSADLAEEDSQAATAEIDTGEICPQCDKPRFHAESKCHINCYYKELCVVVKLKEGAAVPDYITVKETFGPSVFTTMVSNHVFVKLAEDAAVEKLEIGMEVPQDLKEEPKITHDPSGTL